MNLKASAQGTLAKTPFAHLLLYVQGKRLTGTLAVWLDSQSDSARGQDRVLFRDGAILGMRPLEPAESAIAGMIRLFRRHEAPYAFYDGQNLLGASESVLNQPVDLFTLLSLGLRDCVREEVVHSVLGRLSARPLRIRAGVPLERLALPPKELAVVDIMRAGPATLEELVNGTDLARHDTRRLLYLLALIRGIETADGSSLQPATDTGASERTNPGQRGRDVSSLGLSAAANETRPGTGSLRLPPAPAGAPLGAGPPSVSVPPPAVASNNAKAPTSSPARKGTGMLVGPPPRTASAPAPSPPSGLSPTESQRWTELADLYSRLDEMNHFQLLGIPNTATPQEVTNAYFARVKRFHPDRLPVGLAPLSHCARRVFDQLTEANEALSHADTRNEYLQAVAAGGGTRASEQMMRDVLDSAVEYQKAEVLVRKRDLPQAMTMLRSALDKSPNESDFLALYAWLLHLMNPAESAPFDEMVQTLDKALVDNPRNERAHYYKGVILKRMKRDKEAMRHFNKALDINPRNVEAAREVRISQMRSDSKAPPAPTTGSNKLLSRLLGGKGKSD